MSLTLGLSVLGAIYFHRGGQTIQDLVEVNLELGGVVTELGDAPVPSVQTSLVQNDGVFNVVASVTHDSDDCIVTGGEFVVIGELDGLVVLL